MKKPNPANSAETTSSTTPKISTFVVLTVSAVTHAGALWRTPGRDAGGPRTPASPQAPRVP